MDLNRDAMLVGLHIAAWSGRLYDRQASDHVAVAHEASTGAGRYNKRLLVNRHSILTPNRRAKLTPLSGTAEVVPVVNRGDPRGFV